MTRVYLAGRYSRREELRTHAAELELAGHTVTSRWLVGHDELDDALCAIVDYSDISRAQVLVSFGEAPRTRTRGGRHVEFGIALAKGLYVFHVGPREHVFHHLAEVAWFEYWSPRVIAYVGSVGIPAQEVPA